MTSRLWIALACLFCTAGPLDADLLWGANGHPFTAYPGIPVSRQLDYLRDLGMKSYRVNITDTAQAPQLATLVKEAKARDIAILPVLTPALDLDQETPARLYARSYDFAVTLVSRFKNDIRIWELGNELENYAIIKACEMQDDGVQYNCSWGPAGGTETSHYYGPRWAKVSAVLKGLSDGAVAADPTIRKAMGTAGWGHLGAFKRMQQDAIRWDISVWHYYEGDPEDAFRFLASLNRPIWVTEFNNAGGSVGGEQQQADALARMMAYLRRHQHAYGVEAAHVYELLDEPYWAPSSEAFMGLVRLNKDSTGTWTPGVPKPAYHAVKRFIASMSAQDESAGTFVTSSIRQDATFGSRLSSRCDLGSFDQGVSSPENQAAYGYCLIMGRMPSPAEQWDHVTAMRKGVTVPQMLIALLNSDEANEKYRPSGLENSEYVAFLYLLLLRRNPDGYGLSAFVSRLKDNQLSRRNLQLELIHSDEFRSRHAVLSRSEAAR